MRGLTQGISRNEVKVAISRMKNGKATGMDGIPVEVWKCLGEEGIVVKSDARMEKLEEGIGDSVRPKNKFEIEGESKTSNDVRCRDIGSEESTREEVGRGGNEDVEIKLKRFRNEIIRGTTKVGEISKKVG